MTYQIHITRQAEQDMEDAAHYIRFTLFNPRTALDLLLKTRETIQSLRTYPERYPIIDDPVLSSRGMRFVPVHHYLVFYLVSEKESHVHIIRFLYGKRNWSYILGEGFSLE